LKIFFYTEIHNQRTWKNPGVVRIARPLHPLLAHPEICLPKFNLDDGLPVEEYIDNFMLSIN